MKDAHKIVMHIAYRLKTADQAISTDAIQRNLQWASQEKVDAERTLGELVRQGYLACIAPDEYVFTPAGEAEAQRISESVSLDEFERLIGRCIQSSAYMDFCEELYGYRLYLFNMMDKQQLDDLFQDIRVLPENTVLDVGCGSGSILNHIAEKFHCKAVGIDRIDEKIVAAVSPSIEYMKSDMDTYLSGMIHADTALFVDSLYFSKDIDSIIKSVKRSGIKTVYMYYSSYLFDASNAEKDKLSPNRTELAMHLQHNELSYRTVAYSKNELNHYQRGLKLLQKYKHAFIEQGIGDVFSSKQKEYEGGLALYEQGLAERYLYVVEGKYKT